MSVLLEYIWYYECRIYMVRAVSKGGPVPDQL